MNHSVLLDISPAALGYSGIPQDARLMYSTFAQSSRVNVTGLFFPLGRVVPSVLRLPKTKAIDQDGSSSLIIGDLMASRGLHFNGIRRPIQTMRALLYLKHLLAGKHWLWDVRMDLFGDAVWRLLFDKTLPPIERAMVHRGHFVTGNFSSMHIVDKTTTFNSFGSLKLPTNSYDFAIFHDSRRVSVSPGTQKLIRYHDPIPIMHPDTVVSSHTVSHLRALRYCASDSFYVCNSEPVREELVRIEPRLEERSIAIPYRLGRPRASDDPELAVADIVRSRLSFVTLGSSASRATVDLVEAEIKRSSENGRTPSYIMAVSTIEPRKNFPGVIRAWERLASQHDKDLRLIIVGSPGWQYDAILSAMAPHVRSGRLWHLEALSFTELDALYRQAICLVFPSFAEGFGFPPMEAMDQGTPAVVSDIAVHRWTMQDAVLYADPYDVKAIGEQIERLAYGPEREQLRADLRRNGERVLRRYSRQTVEDQWCNLFDKLNTRRQK